MAKIKPLVLEFTNQQDLEKMAEEYRFIGRETEVDKQNLKLVVLTLPKKYKKKTDRENKIYRAKNPESEYATEETEERY